MNPMEGGTPLSELFLTLSEDVGKLIEAMIEGANNLFNDSGEVPPAICTYADGCKPQVFPAKHRNDMEKSIVWAFLRFLRETHPVVILVSEIWASKCDKGKDPYKQTRPSDDPNHTEMVMLSVWDGERTIMIAGDITRNPNTLGEFKVRSDSNDGECHLEGELAKGKPFKRKDRRYEL